MQNRSFGNRVVLSPTGTSTQHRPVTSPPKAVPPREDLSRIFNTALVGTQEKERRNFSSELREITDRAAFKAILSAVRQLAGVQGIDERQAAEQVIQTFRKVDAIWDDYIFQEGLDRIRGPRSSK